MSIHLNEYHDAVIKHLTSGLTWAKFCQAYPESQTAIDTPCLFFQIEDFERSQNQSMSGTLSVVLQCEIIAVLCIDDPAHQIEVRNAAMSVANFVNGNRFGLPIKEAVFQSASPDSFNPELDGYSAWSIKFSQEIEVGKNEYEPNFDDIIPHTVHVGFCPEIGANHEEDYEQVMPINGIEPR